MTFIHQIEPYLTENDIAAVTEYLRSGGWLTEFQKTAEFEERLAEFVSAKHATVVTSGTAALYLSLLALGIGPGDSVIVPDFTMVATPNVVRWAGAEPILCDIDPQTLCLDLSKVRLRPDTLAVIYVPINGRSGDMQEVRQYCRRHGLVLIEDACQALGSRSGGQCLGTFGDVGVFSFTPHKIITTGQGGAVVTNNDNVAAKIRKLKDFHRTKPGVDQHDGIGFNFKFTDLQAVIGIEQLKIIQQRIEQRRNVWRTYADELADVEWLEFLPLDTSDAVPWFADVLLKGVDKQPFLNYLKQQGIGGRTFYPPLHTQLPYAGQVREFPVTTDIASRGVWLPSSIQLPAEDLRRVIDTIRAYDGPKSEVSQTQLPGPHWGLKQSAPETQSSSSD